MCCYSECHPLCSSYSSRCSYPSSTMDIKFLLNPTPKNADADDLGSTPLYQTRPFPLILPKPFGQDRTGVWSTHQGYTDDSQQTLRRRPCHVHPGTKKYRNPFLPEDDATIIYFDNMHGPSKRALRLAFNRGSVMIDSQRDALYGYRPSMSCLACWSLRHRLRKMRCQ